MSDMIKPLLLLLTSGKRGKALLINSA